MSHIKLSRRLIALVLLSLSFIFSAIRLLQGWSVNQIEKIDSGPLIPRPRSNESLESIYVLSLPHRNDRRLRMESLRSYLGLNWTYVNATSPEEEIVGRILKNVKRLREEAMRARQELQRARDEKVKQQVAETDDYPDDLEPDTVNSSAILFPVNPAPSGVKLPFEWPSFSDEVQSPGHSLMKTQILLFLASFDVYSLEYNLSWRSGSFVSVTDDDSEYLSQFLTDAETGSVNLQLVSATKDFSLAPYSATLPYHKFLTSARVAVWHSHLRILKKVVESSRPEGLDRDKQNEHISVILEDDIDIEKDIRRRLQYIWDILPADWDIVFLGHCWSNEALHPAINSPKYSTLWSQSTLNSLHPSYSPRCTHAYAVSPQGASKLLAHLEYPPFAYSRAIDQAYAWLALSERIKAYSVVRSVIVQLKTGTEGSGDVWRPRPNGEEVISSSRWKEELWDGVLGI